MQISCEEEKLFVFNVKTDKKHASKKKRQNSDVAYEDATYDVHCLT